MSVTFTSRWKGEGGGAYEGLLHLLVDRYKIQDTRSLLSNNPKLHKEKFVDNYIYIKQILIGFKDAIRPYCTIMHCNLVIIMLVKTISVGVMVIMLALWAAGPQNNTQSGSFNGNHYLNGMRHIYATWWTKLAVNNVTIGKF